MLAIYYTILVLVSISFPAHCELALPGALVPLTSPRGEEMLYRAKWKEDAILLLENFVAQASNVSAPCIAIPFTTFHALMPCR